MTDTNAWGRPVGQRSDAKPLPAHDDLAAMFAETGLAPADAALAARGLAAGTYLTVEDAVSSRRLWSREGRRDRVDPAKVAEMAAQLGYDSRTVKEQVTTLLAESRPSGTSVLSIDAAKGIVLFHDTATSGARHQDLVIDERGGVRLKGYSRSVLRL